MNIKQKFIDFITRDFDKKLESNIINITLLLGGIIYLGSSALSESLSERQEKIVGAIQEAEASASVDA